MKVLCACEESQEVTFYFRCLGVDAYSCDIQDCSGGFPEWHIKTDVRNIINDKWDLIIAFPPCTYLCVTGNSWYNIDKYGYKAINRYKEREKAIEFFMLFANHNCKYICIENPIGIMSTIYMKPTQYIQPFEYGHNTRKKTCLWLKNLPCLVPTNIVKPDIIKYKNGKGTDDYWHISSINLPPLERQKLRSKTFPGIAQAMANQWYNYLMGVL